MSTERYPALICGWLGATESLNEILQPLAEKHEIESDDLAYDLSEDYPEIFLSKIPKKLKPLFENDTLELSCGYDTNESGDYYIGIKFNIYYDSAEEAYELMKDVEAMMNSVVEGLDLSESPKFYNIIYWF